MNSYWISSTENLKSIHKLDNDYTADVCVVGAGITGLSTAYYLSKNGLKVIVVDKDDIGKKASGHTTAKITLQHGLIYDYLFNTFNLDFAKKYFCANKEAIDNIKNIIDSEKIDCDFEYKNNYIYASKKEDVQKIKNEITAINTIYCNSYSQFVQNCGLPFETFGAIEIQNQAQFHPRKYMLGLAKSIINNNGLIFTNSLVYDVKKYNNGYICYTDNFEIKSKYLVIASHYPFINFPGFYFSKMYQSTSYAIAIDTEKKVPNEMYINDGEPVLSFRTIKDKDKRLLIISGGNHKTGYSPDSEDFYGYSYLKKKALELFPDCKVLYKWDTRDCISLDKVPYIGEFSMFMTNAYVATGFNKWGMTSSNVAANIICDSILEKDNLYADIFNSKRFGPIKNKDEMKNMINQVYHSFVSNRINIPKKNLSAIKNENGGIININGSSVGIYKSSTGEIYAVDPTCTHLGCLLTWNNVDKTWDCPCHGSRFDFTGKNLYDPAFKDLDKYEIE